MSFDNPIACGSPKAETQIETGFSDLAKSIGNLDDLISRVNDKITPVLRMEPGNKEVSSAPDCTLVPLAEELRNQRRRVDSLVDYVQSWLNRIEL